MPPAAPSARSAGPRDLLRRPTTALKQLYGGMTTAELRRLKQLEAENLRLKKLVADLSLDNAMLEGAG